MSPFDLENEDAYRRWRDAKLAAYPPRVEDLAVEVADLRELTPGERAAVVERIAKTNMALLVYADPSRRDRETLAALGAQLGLTEIDANLCADEDAISTLTVSDQGRGNEYTPYTNRPLSWHTDGYYNAANRQVRGWALLCAQDAAEGGENALLDPEILYIQMREREPEMIRAFLAPDALRIPPNREDGEEIRPERTGPVFSVDPADRTLHMRFSARARNIAWKDDPATRAALAFTLDLFSTPSVYIYRHRLEPGQCLVSNNVLHNRTGFRDSAEKKRVIYRARYHHRIRP